MPPIADTITWKVWIEYTANSHQHELLLRFNTNPTVDPGTLARVNAIIASMKAQMNTQSSVTGARYSSPGAAFSLPLTVNTGVGTVTPTTITQEVLASFQGLSARSTQGVEVTYHLFCQAAASPNEYRLPLASLPGALSFWPDEMTGNQSPTPLVAVDGNAITFRTYSNFGQNAYWQRKQR